MGQGRENSKRFLKENAEVASEIEKAVQEIAAPYRSEPIETDEDDEAGAE